MFYTNLQLYFVGHTFFNLNEWAYFCCMKQLIYLICIYFSILFFTSCKQDNETQNTLAYKQNEVKHLTDFLTTRPDSAGLRLIVANKLDSIGEYKNALLQIDTLLKSDSSKYGLWVAKANILLDSGNTTEAKNIFQKAIAIYSGNEAVMSLSEILANEKNDSCLIIAKQFAENQNLYYNYISALYFDKINNTLKADSLLDKCILTDHYFVKPYLLKGKILQQSNQPDKALIFYKEGLNTEPRNIALLNNIAETYWQMKQADSAKSYFAKSLIVQPFQPKVSEQLKNKTN
ncbi:MAG TPA: tetratricopeptide repeat protein [Arachidicoccus sp.]